MWVTRSNGMLPTWKVRSRRATSVLPFDAATEYLRSQRWRATNAASGLNWPWNSRLRAASGASPAVDCAPHISSFERYQTYCSHTILNARSNYVQLPGTNSRLVHAKVGVAGRMRRGGAAAAPAGALEPTTLAKSHRRARARESEPAAATAETANHGAIVAAGGSRRRPCAIRFRRGPLGGQRTAAPGPCGAQRVDRRRTRFPAGRLGIANRTAQRKTCRGTLGRLPAGSRADAVSGPRGPGGGRSFHSHAASCRRPLAACPPHCLARRNHCDSRLAGRGEISVRSRGCAARAIGEWFVARKTAARI